MTFAPCWAAQRIPSATSGSVAMIPLSGSSWKTRTARIGDEYERPAIPGRCSLAAAAIPATWVPCPAMSTGLPGAQPPTQVAPFDVMFEARSSWPASTPVSTIPTVAPGAGEKLPGKRFQPASAEIAGSAHCTPSRGSFGEPRVSARRKRFGSA